MKKLAVSALILSIIFSSNQSAFAVGSSGFENASYSAKTLAQANATVARPQDPSTVLSNPAGLMELDGVQTATGLQGLNWKIYHKNKSIADRFDERR